MKEVMIRESIYLFHISYIYCLRHQSSLVHQLEGLQDGVVGHSDQERMSFEFGHERAVRAIDGRS